jgi:hypothetical protein
MAILTPGRLDETLADLRPRWDYVLKENECGYRSWISLHGRDLVDTIAELREIVQELADSEFLADEWCHHCGEFFYHTWDNFIFDHTWDNFIFDHTLEGEHKPDCLWLRAQKWRTP